MRISEYYAEDIRVFEEAIRKASETGVKVSLHDHCFDMLQIGNIVEEMAAYEGCRIVYEYDDFTRDEWVEIVPDLFCDDKFANIVCPRDEPSSNE